MENALTLIYLLLLILVLSNSSINAQGVQIKKQVIGSGGSIGLVNDENIKLYGTVNQFAIGDLIAPGSNETRIYQGFWVPDDEPTGVEENNISIRNGEVMNYPNPFTSSTTIQYELKSSSYVTIKIFNLMGNLVRVLSNDYQDAGSQKIVWDGKDAQGIELGSGSYLYEISISPAQLTGAPSFSQFVLRNVMIITR